MYAIKEAVIAKEHSGDDLECAIFYMDMRTHGKDFERFYNNAKDKGVRFVRSRVHTIDPVRNSDELSVRYVDDNGGLLEENFDMIVLSVGLETPPDVKALAEKTRRRAHRGQLQQNQHVRPGGDVSTRHLCLRRLPRPQGHSPVCCRCQCRGGGGGGEILAEGS